MSIKIQATRLTKGDVEMLASIKGLLNGALREEDLLEASQLGYCKEFSELLPSDDELLDALQAYAKLEEALNVLETGWQ